MGSPAKRTAMYARVFDVRAAMTASSDALSVSASTSTSTGVAPTWAITSALAANVHVGTMTSSPGPTPIASSARCSAAVAELTATAFGNPTNAANASSNSLTRGPVVSHPESRTARTASFSRSVIDGRANGRNASCARGSLMGLVVKVPGPCGATSGDGSTPFGDRRHATNALGQILWRSAGTEDRANGPDKDP